MADELEFETVIWNWFAKFRLAKFIDLHIYLPHFFQAFQDPIMACFTSEMKNMTWDTVYSWSLSNCRKPKVNKKLFSDDFHDQFPPNNPLLIGSADPQPIHCSFQVRENNHLELEPIIYCSTYNFLKVHVTTLLSEILPNIVTTSSGGGAILVLFFGCHVQIKSMSYFWYHFSILFAPFFH